jgi:hypothetical protein
MPAAVIEADKDTVVAIALIKPELVTASEGANSGLNNLKSASIILIQLPHPPFISFALFRAPRFRALTP